MTILYAVLAAASLVGCTDISEETVPVVPLPPSLQGYAAKPEPGTLLEFPPVPLLRSPKSLVPDYNGFSNPGFEEGASYWTVSDGKTSACGTTDLLSADGSQSYQVVPSAGGDVFISQTLPLEPRTFYSFSALLFIPESSEASLEVRDVAGNTLLRGEALSGPLSEWSYRYLTFVTGNLTEQVTLGIHCSSTAENSPILIDGCAVNVFPPAANLLLSGTMETLNETVDVEPGEGEMPVWYLSGESVSATSAGYQSEHALELPSYARHASTIIGLVPVRPPLDGRAVWISAMTRSVPDGDGPPPQVDISLRFVESEELRPEIRGTSPATDDWVETSFMATMPNVSDEVASLPFPFHTLFFDSPAGIEGRIYIDDVVMYIIPEGRFDGGLPSAAHRISSMSGNAHTTYRRRRPPP